MQFTFPTFVVTFVIIHYHQFIFSFAHPLITISSFTKSSSSSFTSERPYFIEKMEPVEVTMGDAVTLKCCIAGTPDISVAWFKADGKLRTSNTCSMDFTNGVATLKLIKTTKFDHGEYVCKAENRVGSACTGCTVTVKGDARFHTYFHSNSFFRFQVLKTNFVKWQWKTFISPKAVSNSL